MQIGQENRVPCAVPFWIETKWKKKEVKRKATARKQKSTQPKVTAGVVLVHHEGMQSTGFDDTMIMLSLCMGYWWMSALLPARYRTISQPCLPHWNILSWIEGDGYGSAIEIRTTHCLIMHNSLHCAEAVFLIEFSFGPLCNITVAPRSHTVYSGDTGDDDDENNGVSQLPLCMGDGIQSGQLFLPWKHFRVRIECIKTRICIYMICILNA